MFDLIWNYLIILELILGFNIGLFLRDFKISKLKYFTISFLLAIVIFILSFFSNAFRINLSFMNNNLGWLFIVAAIILFFIEYIYIKKNEKLFCAFAVMFLLSVIMFILSSQFVEVTVFDSLLWALFLFIILISSYPISTLLYYAKNEYSVVVGEFISIEAILVFVFGITFWSVSSIDYKMFSSFLILTPTYKLIYVIIGLVFVMILGLYYNDRKIKRGNL